MPEQIKLTPDEAKVITPFFQWSEGYLSGMAAGLDAAKRRLVNDLIAARMPETPKQEVTNDPAVPTAG